MEVQDDVDGGKGVVAQSAPAVVLAQLLLVVAVGLEGLAVDAFDFGDMLRERHWMLPSREKPARNRTVAFSVDEMCVSLTLGEANGKL